MFFITVGQVSGLIALGVFVVQTILPLAIVAILISVLQNEHNAVTWSVVGRSIQSSLWPVILRTDSVSSRKVKLHVSVLSWLVTLSVILSTITAIVTPLGLEDVIKAGDPIRVHFQYAPDISAFGFSTPPRYNRFSRLCGFFLYTNCPGADAGYITIKNTTGLYSIGTSDAAIINSTIPANLTEMFSSATSDDGNTLSGAFDIQYRTWRVSTDKINGRVDAGSPYATGSYRAIDNLILHNKTEAVEGVVVDTVRGGVGYRNHSVPTGLQYGGKWNEDLTWVEPVTSCVDTNLTFRFSLSNRETNITSISLVDNGGFVDLANEDPYSGLWNDTQNPDLQARAHRAAWNSNHLTAVFYNMTYPGNTGARNTSKGAEFPLDTTIGTYRPDLNSIQLRAIDGSYLGPDLSPNSGNFTGLNLSSSAQAKLSITSDNFTTAQILCQGWGPGDYSNITNTLVNCGYLYGAPHRIDNVESLVFEPETNWTQNLYVCATGIRSSIKTVGFSINRTSSLSDLEVVSVEDKNYPDNSSRPLWGVEDTNSTIREVRPVWGLVHDRYETAEGLWTLRAEKFWLPAVSNDLIVTASTDSLASTEVFGAALSEVYESSAKGSSYGQLADYSGRVNVALSRLWRELSMSSASASSIIDLIYAEVLATATVGTKSAVTTSPSGDGSDVPNTLASTTKFTRQLQYNFLYAIPAAIIVACTVVAVLFVFIMWIMSRFSVALMRQLLNQTSTGRLCTNLLYPGLCEPTAPTSKWIDNAGLTKLAFSMMPKDEAVAFDRTTESQKSQPRTSSLKFGQTDRNTPLYRGLSQEDVHKD